jgi:hypothetical protein
MGWHELRKEWHDTTVDYCDVCGNLLIHRYFAFIGDDGQPRRACREDDERIYHKLLEFRPAMVEARAAAGRTKAP